MRQHRRFPFFCSLVVVAVLWMLDDIDSMTIVVSVSFLFSFALSLLSLVGMTDGVASLVPSQVTTYYRQPSKLNSESLSSSETHKTIRRSRRQRRRKPRKETKRRKKRAFPSSGNVPNVFWRAIPMEHLRMHPLYAELGPPAEIQRLKSLEDARLFRQESWQWDALHDGRCTTSQAVAALGLLEPTVSQILGVPPAWRRGGMGAYKRLSQPALRTLDEMNRVLCRQTTAMKTNAEEMNYSNENIWSKSERENFTYSYTCPSDSEDDEELAERRKSFQNQCRNDNRGMVVRLAWGNTQEATSLLTALNFFNGSRLRETGMCGAGLNLQHHEIESSLLVGATPDGILEHPDGTLEAVEVKNHCPFVCRKGGPKLFSISSRPLHGHGVFPQYIPQLQMEMFCLGPKCQSAVMIRQTATQGAIILRMKRDDKWIREMLYWLHCFQRDFVEAKVPPPKDFFYYDVAKKSRYRRFVNHTSELKNRVEVVAEIPHASIQRTPNEQTMFLDSAVSN